MKTITVTRLDTKKQIIIPTESEYQALKMARMHFGIEAKDNIVLIAEPPVERNYPL